MDGPVTSACSTVTRPGSTPWRPSRIRDFVSSRACALREVATSGYGLLSSSWRERASESPRVEGMVRLKGILLENEAGYDGKLHWEAAEIWNA